MWEFLSPGSYKFLRVRGVAVCGGRGCITMENSDVGHGDSHHRVYHQSLETRKRGAQDYCYLDWLAGYINFFAAAVLLLSFSTEAGAVWRTKKC